MLKAVVFALLATSISGEVITIRSAQANTDAPGFTSETVYVLGNEEPSWSRASAYSRFQGGQSAAGVPLFSRAFQLQPTSSILGPGLLLGSGLSDWVEGQLEVLSELQALLSEEEDGSACGHGPPASTRTALPGMLGYMASTRFGPAFYTTFLQQGEGEEMYGDDADALGDWAPEERAGLGRPQGRAGQRLGQNAPAEVVVMADPAPHVHSWALATAAGDDKAAEEWEYPTGWGQAAEEGQAAQGYLQPAPAEAPMEGGQEGEACVNWGLVLLCTLVGACCAVWGSLFMAWRRLAAASRPAAQCAPACPLRAQLLAPLPAEKCVGPTAGRVEVAADAVERGIYHAPIPSGSEYVTIAYVPLKGEA